MFMVKTNVKILPTKAENKDNTENTTVQYKVIGNTTFKLVSHYSGRDTYMDIVKNVLKMELDRA